MVIRSKKIKLMEMRNSFKILVGKSEGKRPLGSPRHRWDISKRSRMGRCGLDSGSEQKPVVGPYEHSNEPSISIKGGEFCD
jgi:hypothetical protein